MLRATRSLLSACERPPAPEAGTAALLDVVARLGSRDDVDALLGAFLADPEARPGLLDAVYEHGAGAASTDNDAGLVLGVSMFERGEARYGFVVVLVLLELCAPGRDASYGEADLAHFTASFHQVEELLRMRMEAEARADALGAEWLDLAGRSRGRQPSGR